jgi:hypothetical protein
MPSIVKKLEASAMKSLVVVAAGAGMCVLSGGAFTPVRVVGTYVPKVVAVSGSLMVSSMASDFVIPAITPWLSATSPELRKFENTFLAPLMVGGLLVGLDSVLMPDVVKGEGMNLTKALGIGFGASVLGGYAAEGLGWIPTVAVGGL